MKIISVPTVFTCKLPKSGWLNLALVRQVQFDDSPDSPIAVIFWSCGDNQIFRGEDAIAIQKALVQVSDRFEKHQDFKDEDIYD